MEREKILGKLGSSGLLAVVKPPFWRVSIPGAVHDSGSLCFTSALQGVCGAWFLGDFEIVIVV